MGHFSGQFCPIMKSLFNEKSLYEKYHYEKSHYKKQDTIDIIQICETNHEELKSFYDADWSIQRASLDKKKYMKFALEYDLNQVLDKNRVENVNTLFEEWLDEEAAMDFMGMRGLNFTLPGF